MKKFFALELAIEFHELSKKLVRGICEADKGRSKKILFYSIGFDS